MFDHLVSYKFFLDPNKVLFFINWALCHLGVYLYLPWFWSRFFSRIMVSILPSYKPKYIWNWITFTRCKKKSRSFLLLTTVRSSFCYLNFLVASHYWFLCLKPRSDGFRDIEWYFDILEPFQWIKEIRKQRNTF